MTDTAVEWLLTGDVSIQYQVHRYLLESDEDVSSSLQERIALEGWGLPFSCLPTSQWAMGELLLPAKMDQHALHTIGFAQSGSLSIYSCLPGNGFTAVHGLHGY
ncbi:hypothetical protein [Bifidobacterium indicum]|uniref:hypothetical protein n=1 Tax=Bifidobacterium indicum TaxID=1691 RepID=UPI0030DB720D